MILQKSMSRISYTASKKQGGRDRGKGSHILHAFKWKLFNCLGVPERMEKRFVFVRTISDDTSFHLFLTFLNVDQKHFTCLLVFNPRLPLRTRDYFNSRFMNILSDTHHNIQE